MLLANCYKILKSWRKTDMKLCGQNFKMTLLVNGREKTFTERELRFILENYFPSEITKQISRERIAKVPTEDKWFEVNPLEINQELFQEKRKDKTQENTRQNILKAFDELNRNPQKYGKKFMTMLPKKSWESDKNILELKDLAWKMGDHMSDIIEKFLEWAQRISNGESWEEVCNKIDSAKWFGAVTLQNGNVTRVGNSTSTREQYPASHVDWIVHSSDECTLFNAVPSITKYVE